MKIYDYSALLTVVRNLDIEKTKLTIEAETNEKIELDNLENKLFASGMLEDWEGLREVLKEAGVRGCPYPEKIPGTCEFEDNYKFVYRVNGGSSGYRQDFYAIMPGCSESPNAVRYYQWSTGYGSEKKIDIFAVYGNDPVMRKVRVKTTLIKEFMENYPKYREIKLKQLYEAIGKKSEKIEKLKTK